MVLFACLGCLFCSVFIEVLVPKVGTGEKKLRKETPNKQ